MLDSAGMIAARDEEARVVIVRVEQPGIEGDRALEFFCRLVLAAVVREHLRPRDMGCRERGRQLERSHACGPSVLDRLRPLAQAEPQVCQDTRQRRVAPLQTPDRA